MIRLISGLNSGIVEQINQPMDCIHNIDTAAFDEEYAASFFARR